MPDVELNAGAGSDAAARCLAAFLAAHDGGRLPGGSHLFTLDESVARAATLGAAGQRGLWPFLEHRGRVYALDAEGTSPDGEWPAAEVTERGVDRVGTSLLRFLHVLAAELSTAAAMGTDLAVDAPRSRSLAEERCRRDPGLADHWLELAQIQEEAGEESAVDTTLAAAVRSATPPTPALLFAVGMRAALHKDWAAASRAFEDAIALEPLAARDDDARLDAAAAVYVLASERGDAAAVASARRVLADAIAATAGFWRIEALHALGAEPGEADLPEVRLRVDLGLRIVAALAPGDPDLARLKEPRSPAMLVGLQTLRRAREALEVGRPADAVRYARTATEQLPELGAAWALLAEAMNANRDRSARDAARRATSLNPTLIEAWRVTRRSRPAISAPPRRPFARSSRSIRRTAWGSRSSRRCCWSRSGRSRRLRRSVARPTEAAIRSSSRPSGATSTPRWSGTPRPPRPTTTR